MNERKIFSEALQIAGSAERAAFLAKACAQDGEMRHRIEGLLTEERRLGSFLESPAVAVGITSDIISGLTEKPGSQIGPYKLREQIGEGGMGVVFVAEQTEPVQRKVALKIIKPGMASKDIVARFEAERQALALMNHPNIARVFDGGVSDKGEPYFVMELVQGPPITDYCDQQQLSIADRLSLFVLVCKAVQHAHQKGIIHRDIKPSNVIVAEIDGDAVPKVIDFGVAKAVGQTLTEATLYTHFAQMVGTPLYMSPEQTSLGVVDVDTRSDVYSLGVLLYELLTGQTPFDVKTLKQVGFDEMRRIIREDDPPKPSAMVNTLHAEALSTVSQRRGSDPRRLCVSLQGELDWLLMKSLEKDRNRRYESASALAADVQRYLSGEPLEARPTSRLYRIARYTRRNRALLASITAIALALSIGLALAIAGYMTAKRSLTEVTKERENYREMAEVLKEMYPMRWSGTNQGRQETVFDSIERVSASLADRLRDHPAVEIEVRRIFGRAYSAAGELDKAQEHLNVALELAEREHGPQHELVGEIHADLADLVGSQAHEFYDFRTPLMHAEKAIAIFTSLGRDAPVRAWFAKQRCLSGSPERRAEAEAAQRECVRLTRGGIISRWDLGLLLINGYRLPEARIEFEEALRTCRASGAEPAVEATVLSGLGKCQRRQGDIAAAQNTFLEAWNLCQDNYMQIESRGQRIGFELVETYFAAGDVDGAFEQIAEMEQLARSQGLVESQSECLYTKGWIHYQLEDYAAAEQLVRQALQLIEFGEDHPRFRWPCAYLAFALEAQGRADEAKPLYDLLRTQVKQRFIDKPVYPAAYWLYVRSMLGTYGRDIPQLREAETRAQQGLDYVSAWPWPSCEWTFLHELGKIQQCRGSLDAAERSLRAGLEKASEPVATSMAQRYDMSTTRGAIEVALANVLIDSGMAEGIDRARQVYEKGVEIRESTLGTDHIQVALAQLRLGEFLAVNSREDDRLEGARQLREAYEKLSTHTSTAVDVTRRRAAQSLAELFEVIHQSDQAASWRSKLEQLDEPVENHSIEPERTDDTVPPSANPPPD